MKAAATWTTLLLGVLVVAGWTNVAKSQSNQFSFSDCNDAIAETKLTKILEHNTQFGINNLDTDTFNRSSQPTELDKPLKINTDAKLGCATCNFSGPSRGGKGIFSSMPIYTGILEICTNNTQSRFSAFSSKNTSNLQRFNQTVIEESAEIGKATIINQMQIENISTTFSVKFLDDDVDTFVDVSIQYSNSLLNPAKSQKTLDNILEKLKDIAKEVEQNIK
jgi:hypothetical protein